MGASKIKYHNTRVYVGGKWYDSKKESRRGTELRLLENAGKIKNLEFQKRFVLQESFKKNGKTFRAITYIADFVYFDNSSKKVIVEDTKGCRTDVYKIKKKLFEKKYPTLEIVEL